MRLINVTDVYIMFVHELTQKSKVIKLINKT